MEGAITEKRELSRKIQKTLSYAYLEIQKDHRVYYKDIEDRILKVDPDFYIPADDILKYLDETFEWSKGLGVIGAPERSVKLNRELIKEKESLVEVEALNF